ncbi:unnamed protein product [Chondrus crispus]|uniref:3-dehydroquinate synthase n=1 Tax=Chondrus crispus TaxID=2769 RepID=R7Q6Z2_CHOCR|nr:unnamed protein product [Chondrus crispus]CDF33141.1 unnamed protein product [Chondrus crispus]|eukprot:XP_005712944.1 unnamed protein product [Chondrus crispus]
MDDLRVLAFSAPLHRLPRHGSAIRSSFMEKRCKSKAKKKPSVQWTAGADKRAFWVMPKSKQALTTALEGNINDFLFTETSDMERWSPLGCFNSTCVDGQGSFPGGRLAVISSADDVEQLMAIAGTNDVIIMDSIDWKAIPAENLIAAFQNTPTKLYALVDTVEDAKAMFDMLEIGVDGCVLRSHNEQEVLAFAALKRQLVDNAGMPMQGMSHARIRSIRPIGVGERVCIDTCSMLQEDEGLMVGSSSQAMFLVLSEAAKVSYVPSRPFRVNAGPVHSYCLVPGGKTKYLAELKAGNEVLVVGDGGKTCRTAIVGRAKIEKRPLLLIEAETEETDTQECTVFVQNAETVRLAAVGSDDEVCMKSVTTLSAGDRLVLKTDRKARHIGIAIEENLVEK